jgi:hypothetical protein
VSIAETAKLLGFHAFGVRFFVFHRVIIALLALGTRQRDFGAHPYPLLSLNSLVRLRLQHKKSARRTANSLP